MADAPAFAFSELLPLGPDTTVYRSLGSDGVSTFETPDGTFVRVDPEAIRRLTAEAMREIAHFLRTDHLRQLRSILDDPEASENDRFVALDLLKNSAVSAGGVLPMCQDTGTAIVKAKKGQFVFTGGGDEAAIAHGVFDTYLTSNLRYSQLAPITMYEESNTGTNLPAEIKISAVDGRSCSSPRAAAVRTRATCSRRPRRCSTRRPCCRGCSTRCRRSAPPRALRTTSRS
jgi:fumarate hydratase, class I